jgi:hypothetical protein
MSLPERRPRVEAVASRLDGLDRVPKIAQAIIESAANDPESSTEALIYNGYDQLVNLYNEVTTSDSYVHLEELIPHTTELKEYLGSQPLPLPEELSAKELVIGIRRAHEAMLYGQRIRSYRRKYFKSESAKAIMAPSIPTALDSSAVGIAGHLYERTTFEALSRRGIDTSEWPKDKILWALEELALLSHAEVATYGETEDRADTLLFDIFTTPADEDGGGMGWRTAEQVQAMMTAYQDAERKAKEKLVDEYRATHDNEEVEDFIEKIQGVPYKDLDLDLLLTA